MNVGTVVGINRRAVVSFPEVNEWLSFGLVLKMQVHKAYDQIASGNNTTQATGTAFAKYRKAGYLL